MVESPIWALDAAIPRWHFWVRNMATRSGSIKQSPRARKQRPAKPAQPASVHVLITHTFKNRVEFARAVFDALRRPPRGIRLRECLYHQDNLTATLTWQARSVEQLKEFIVGRLKGSSAKGYNPVRFDPTPPVITSVFPFSVIKPNGGVIIQGRNFGDHPGQFLLKATGFTGGSVSLGSLQWNDSVVAGVIPNIFGVQDQPASLQIVTAEGRFSNEWPCHFTAAREVRILPGNIFNIAIGGSDPYNSEDLGDESTGYTLRIWHHGDVTPVANIFSGGDGTDSAICELKNGWVYYGYQWTADTSGINGSPFGPLPEPVNESRIQLAVSWFHDSFSAAQYGLVITAVGPVGVPFQ